MPEVVQWALLAGLVLTTAIAIAWPLIGGRRPDPAREVDARAEARALRHRIALEALLDVEADRRAGSLDDTSYQRERTEAEERAARTLTDEGEGVPPPPAPPMLAHGRRAAAWLGAGLGAALLVGFALPAPPGLAERTVVNQALADEQARETARQAEIQRLLTALNAHAQDAQVLSDLADAYLAGSGADDLRRAAVALQVLLAVEPQNQSAYRRLITAYISAADWSDARAATDSYAAIVGGEDPDIPFFLGLIAFRTGNGTTALQEFDRFLQLAPHDGRAAMVSSLRAEAAGQLPRASASPGA